MLAAAVAAVSVTACSLAHADCYSDGYRTGTIQKISKTGLIFKSYEGELVMEGLKLRNAANATTSGNVWRFSARSDETYKRLEKAMLEGRVTTVRYCQELFSFTTNTKYIITAVSSN